MTKRSRMISSATLRRSAITYMMAVAGVQAQAVTPAPIVPNFIDARPVPRTAHERIEEQEARRKADEELGRLAAEAEANRRTIEEAKRLATEADARRSQQQIEQRAAAAAAANRSATEAEARRPPAETDARRVNAELEAKRKAADEAGRQATLELETRRDQDVEIERKFQEAQARRAAAVPSSGNAPPKRNVGDLVVRGRQLMGVGDFVSARLVLDRAAAASDADAAFALAETFDAEVIGKFLNPGVVADGALADAWRARARALGGVPRSAPPTATAPATTHINPPGSIAAFAPPMPTPAPRPKNADAAPAAATAQVPLPEPMATATTAVTSPPAAMDTQSSVLPEAARFLTRGRQLLQQGDIDAARLFFERAMHAGSAQGALELGTTYDPVALRDLGVVGLQGNSKRAADFYRQALQMGSADASPRLARLGAR